MLFTDAFKKLTGKELAGFREDPAAPADTTRRETAAAREFLPILKERLTAADGRLHAGTVLCAAAWLTGTSLYRSLHAETQEPPGSILESDEVHTEWESLVRLLEERIFQKAEIPAGRLVLAAMAAPAFFKARVDVQHVHSRLQDPYAAVMRKHRLDDRAAARAGVLLCSIIIQQYSDARIIEPDAAAGIAAQAIFEAASVMPPPLEPTART